jgi:formylglycine-generating enzyme required for sulfatase activity
MHIRVTLVAILILGGSFAPEAQQRVLKPGDSFKECHVCPEMVVVPAGKFIMGSPKHEPGSMWWWESQHQVFVVRPFAVGKFAITVDQFDGFIKETSYDFGTKCKRSQDAYSSSERPDIFYRSPGFDQSGSHPVVCVSFEDATAYVSWLSGKTGKMYRLPSEAEREYVTRGGTATPFWWGSTILTDRANYNGTPYDRGPPGEFRRKTVPVDSFAANPWGLYQVHGNVFEWLEDCHHTGYAGAPINGDPWITPECHARQIRGGAWSWSPQFLRSAARSAADADVRSDAIGFRVARTLTP